MNRGSRLVPPREQPNPGSIRAFTLIELMAVVLVILVLAGITIGVAGYVKNRMAASATRSLIAAMEAALESYKSDWGYYPKTLSARISHDGYKEATNNWYLYRALSGAAGKRYMSFPAQQIQTNMQMVILNIYDQWGSPYNYYNSPTTSYSVMRDIPPGYPAGTLFYGGYTFGGQVNVTSYDLFSYGPDRRTYVACTNCYPSGLNYAWWYSTPDYAWTNTAAALDDITNWKP